MSITEMPGGHCFYCHQDYTEYHKDHPCFKVPYESGKKSTPCEVIYGRDCQYNPKGFYIEKWTNNNSSNSVREDHYFVGKDRQYIWGFNPKFVPQELADKIFELIKPHIK